MKLNASDKASLWIAGLFFAFCAFWLAFVSTVGYVAIHFVLKFW